MPRARNIAATDMERRLREACSTLRLAEGTGCLPARASGQRAARLPDAGALERLADLIRAIAAADLSALQRDLLWRRAQGVAWKQLAHDTGVPDSTLSRRYDAALMAVRTALVRRIR